MSTQQQQLDPSAQVVYTLPAQDATMVQPTLGRIAMGVFLGHMMTGVVGLIVYAIITTAT